MDSLDDDIDIVWTAELTVGSPALDGHNRDMLGRLARAATIIDASDPAYLADWLTECCEQLDALLLAEEDELAAVGYPELAFHRRLHDRARAITRDTRNQLARVATPAALQALARASCTAMGLWLPRHVVDADRLFFPYVDERFRVM